MSTETGNHTIVAVATPPGRGAIGIIRVSGPNAIPIAKGICRRERDFAHARALTSGFYDTTGELVDRGVLLTFLAPRSYTGEDVVEFQCHGSPVVLSTLLEMTISLGARAADPGEFSLRAFLAGKLDLAQAEAVADLIDSQSRAAARAAVRSLEGEFSRLIASLKVELVALRVLVEAAIDFADEDIDPLSENGVDERLSRLREQVGDLLLEAQGTLRAFERQRVVLCGKPNVGKSSLMNRLSGRDAAIVTPIAGTTRDVIKEFVQLGELQVELLDTAGLRVSNDVVEQEGVRRARLAIDSADAIVLVVDATETSSRARPALLAEHALTETADRTTIVVNKIDLTGESETLEQGVIGVSATTGAGIAVLVRALQREWPAQAAEPRFFARQRHVVALQEAREALARASDNRARRVGLELIAEDLRLAQQQLAELVGEMSSDALLGEIFARFCIGK